MSETIYLVAPAGHPNFGDEFIVSAWLRELYRRRPTAQVILDCHTPGIASILHANVHPNLTVTDTLWHVGLKCATPEDVVQAFNNTYSIPLLTTGMNLAKTADIVHVVGGGWFNDTWPHHVKVLAGASCLGKQAKIMTGQGFVPGTTIKDELAIWLEKFDRVLVRDEPSHALHQAISVVDRGVDDAWLAAADSTTQHGLGWGNADARERDFIIAAQSDFLGIELEELAQRLVKQLRYLGATGDNAVFLECIPEEDYKVLDVMVEADAALMDGIKVVAFDELWAFGLPTREGQTWISTRFHPHLIAAARGVSGIAVSAHAGNYYSVKHGSVGSSWTITDLSEPVDPGRGMTKQHLENNVLRAFELAEEIYPMNRSQYLKQSLKSIGRAAKQRLKK
ncbi:polysaccharide pyruvyl transferase family protein [Corynebacterium sp. L4756]|uniref:polysaccharide pyruvyl transferase family protein n=1 Tax=unclassified Corynebacterium TaxID=2624378 RepID=UPI00374D563A